MSSFTESLIVKKVTGRTWEVEKSFEYHVGSEDSDEVIIVPKGFITDFASVPRIAWILIPPDGRYSQAAVLHDFLYFIKVYTRRRCDQIFLEAMKVLKVSMWKRSIMFMAVRIAGWISWNNRKPLIMTKPFLIIIFLILTSTLTSCASTTVSYYDKGANIGKIKKIQGWGLQEAEIKPDGTIKYKMALDWWPKDVLTLYKD